MRSIGRIPRLFWEALHVVNEDEAAPGRDWYLKGVVVDTLRCVDRISASYTLDLLRRDIAIGDDSEVRVLFTEEEARALCALLNGLEMGPTPEDKRAFLESFEKAYSNATEITLKIPRSETEYKVEPVEKKRSKKK